MENKRIKKYIYYGLWTLICAILLLDGLKPNSMSVIPVITLRGIIEVLKVIIPFIALFLINNLVLIPKFLLRNKYKSYFIFVSILLGVIFSIQFALFLSKLHFMPLPPIIRHRHIIPLPLLMDITYDILILGGDCAVSMIFKSYNDNIEHERLLKINAQNQLTYLKGQINPHFYMNMLNNIHGMIEIDPEKAQTMVLDMSILMRYMLYESGSERIPLTHEIAFLSKYIELMRTRYPEDKVKITTQFPTDCSISGLSVPPLLYLMFVENAFKHGVSFQHDSFIAIDLHISDSKIIFKCLNSRFANMHEDASSGIGLANVGRRLELIYGDRASITASEGDNYYCVTLLIPAT